MLAYHWAPTAARRSIEREGLRGSSTALPRNPAEHEWTWAQTLDASFDKVCLCEDPEVAWKLIEGYRREHCPSFDLWEVELTEEDDVRRHWLIREELRANPIPARRIRRVGTRKSDAYAPRGNRHPRRSEADNRGWELFTPRRSSART